MANDSSTHSKFVEDVKHHVDASVFRYVRQDDLETEFNRMVLDFFNKYGSKYSGIATRDHLQEPDPDKGFL